MLDPPDAGSSGRAAADVDRCADRILEAVPRAMREIRREMRAGASPGLTVPQMRTLLFVRRRPDASLSELAEHLGASPSTCSVLVDRLVRDGLVDRSSDPSERRRVRLRATPVGLTLVDDARGRTRSWLRRGLAELPHDDLAALERALAALELVTGRHASEVGR